MSLLPLGALHNCEAPKLASGLYATQYCLHGEAISTVLKVLASAEAVWGLEPPSLYKATLTAISDVRDVMPECVIKVSYPISSTLHLFYFIFRMFVEDSQTLTESHTRILNHLPI